MILFLVVVVIVRSALVYGAKKWVIYPPHDQVMSNRQILEYLETDAIEFMNRPMGKAFAPTTCIQTAGDVIIIPESWGHGVLNIQESIAIATETKTSFWRLRPSGHLLNLLPDSNDASRTRNVNQEEWKGLEPPMSGK